MFRASLYMLDKLVKTEYLYLLLFDDSVGDTHKTYKKHLLKNKGNSYQRFNTIGNLDKEHEDDGSN